MLSYLPLEASRVARAMLCVWLGCAGLALAACDAAAPAYDAEPAPIERDAGSSPHEQPDAEAEREAGAPAMDAGPGRAMEAGARHDDAASASADATSPAEAGASPADASADAAPIADSSADAAPPDAGAERSRGFAVGTRRIEIGNDAGRVLPVQLWYPARDEATAEAEAGHAITEFEPAGARRELLGSLIAEAREDCPKLTMHAALDAEPYPRSAPFPLLVYSHHFNGSRFSMFTIAEGLAREGIVVAAPDHVGGSLFEREDALVDALRQFNDAFLQTRVADLRRILDVLLDANASSVPPGLRGRLDPARVGAFGHSLGGITVGVLSARDTRVRASAYVAIIPSPSLAMLLFDLPRVEQLRTPALYLSASDDSSVESLGGRGELAASFEGQPAPAVWVDVRDTGHFSFADDCGLAPEFEEGCGTGPRVVDGQTFTYIPTERAREIATRYTALFFAAELSGAPREKLAEALPPELVTVKQRGEGSAGAEP